jgi:CBS domain containing-hemolysin-like protein
LLDLTPLVGDVAFVPETIRIDRLLTELKKRRQQIAIIIDEYGSTAGIVTLADLLEQVFGELPDEDAETEPDVVQRSDGTIQLAGGISIDEVNELFGLGFPTEEAVTMADWSSMPGSSSCAGMKWSQRTPSVLRNVDRLRISEPVFDA